jgi:hypothetical protein
LPQPIAVPGGSAAVISGPIALQSGQERTRRVRVNESGKFCTLFYILLRMLKIADGITEEDVAAFFGFSPSEMAYVVNDMEEQGYVERTEGALWLTNAGSALFRPGSEDPEIYDVEQRSERHGFDLISLAPANFARMSRFDAELPELQPASTDRIAMASKLLPAAFRKHFDAIVRARGSAALKQTLYAVDDISAGRRYSTVVPIGVRARSTLAAFPEPSLAEVWTGYDLEDRSEVVEAAATLIKGTRVGQQFAGAEALRRLASVAKETLAEFVTAGAVRRDAFYREVVKRAGEFRSDRLTVPIIGSVFTDGNRDRLSKALDYSREREKSAPRTIGWQAPVLPRWGATRRLPQTLEMIQKLLGETSQNINTVAMAPDRPPWHLVQAFDSVINSRALELDPAAIEVLVVPRHVATVLVHTAVGQGESYPVPLGIMSLDPRVIARAQELLLELQPLRMVVQGERTGTDLEMDIEAALADRATIEGESVTPLSSGDGG